PSFYTHTPLTTLQPDGAEQYTMTIRLRVNDANGLKAEDRRSVGLRHDPDLLPGYPKSVNRADGDAAPTYADLEGTHELDLIVPNGNGEVNVWRPDGTEVPGFPVFSQMRKQLDPLNPENYRARAYRNANLANVRDPLSGGAAVGDLFHNGELEIVATSTNGEVYAWDSHGRLLPGFPVGQDRANWEPFTAVPTPRAATGHSRNPDRGTSLLGFNPSNDAAATWLYGLYADGNNHRGGPYIHAPDGTWPVTVQSASFTYDQSIDFVGESTSPPAIADFGSGPRIITGPITGGVYSIKPDGTVDRRFDFSCPSADCSSLPPYRTGDSHTLVLTGTGGLGDLYGTGTPAFIMNNTGVESIVASLQVPGVASLPQVYEKAWDPRDGQVLPGWPKRVDGFPFYASPITADVAGLGLGRSAIEGNDTYFIHAFQASGLEAPGFPKYTGQWQAFAGVVADPLMNGQLVYAIPTREGFVFTWKVAGDTALNDSWWHYRHDEHNTGTYGVDARRPASILDLR